jgi:hypothetical protein
MFKGLLTLSAAVLLGLGLFQFAPQTAAQPPAAQATSRYFPETQHWVRGVFLKYWNEHGGLAQQGYPLTEEFSEVNKLNGTTYTVQYFERAIFEHHPENAGTPYEVLLSQLGRYELDGRYPNSSQPAAAPVPGPGAGTVPFYEDRSGPLQLLVSYYNAINRREYQRAYGYWETPTSPYAQFVQGYADTQSVTLLVGTPATEGAAGSTFGTVPVVLIAQHNNNTTQTFSGCYVTRRTNPGISPDPNAVLWRIYGATIQEAPANVPYATLLAQPCNR